MRLREEVPLTPEEELRAPELSVAPDARAVCLSLRPALRSRGFASGALRGPVVLSAAVFRLAAGVPSGACDRSGACGRGEAGSPARGIGEVSRGAGSGDVGAKRGARAGARAAADRAARRRWALPDRLATTFAPRGFALVFTGAVAMSDLPRSPQASPRLDRQWPASSCRTALRDGAAGKPKPDPCSASPSSPRARRSHRAPNPRGRRHGTAYSGCSSHRGRSAIAAR